MNGPIWFGVSKWADAPEEKTFDRVTESRLYYRDRGRNRFENKITTYKRWYPTREEAQAAIDNRNANTVERKRMNRIRDAAPDMLAALERLAAAGEATLAAMDAYNEANGTHIGGYVFFEIGRGVADARAAIAKALGRTPNEIGEEG